MRAIDLHVHSKFSKRPSQWVLQKIGCPESFTEPTEIYRIARQRGMSLVTISDHNTIDGALEIAHLPGTFVSEEATTYFPEDGCKAHVLALSITEAQHREIQKIRKNIFELVPYLNAENIVHVIAHPLYGVNDRLKIGHFEQMLLLFKNFELNGARNGSQNRILRYVLSNLKPEDIDRLADKYGIEPAFPDPWKKNLTGGSDDHSGLNIARTFTRLPDTADSVETALAALENHEAEVISGDATPLTMAHNLYGIAYQFYRNKFDLENHVRKDSMLRFLDASLRPEIADDDGLMSRICGFLNHRKRKKSQANVPETLSALLRNETDRLLRDHPELLAVSRNPVCSHQEREKNWFNFVNRVSSQVMSHSANHLFDHLSGANVFNIFQTIGSAGGLYTLLAPYFVSFSQFNKDRDITEEVIRRFAGDVCEAKREKGGARVAHFTDTFYDVNGVAQTLQQQVEIAIRNNRKLTVITCNEDHRPAEQPGLRNFTPIGVYELPEYPEQKICYPPFLEMLNYCCEQKFTHIQAATPGPMGLAALAIAHILKLPVNGTYHTAFPQYAQYLTGDNMIEDLTWKFTLWFYDRMDMIYVSSRSSADELTEKGIHPDKVRLIPRGIDTEMFHPANRNGFYESRYNIRESVKLIYVGRVSREKNLPLLTRAFKTLIRSADDIRLIVVGDGPSLSEMKAELGGTPVTFTGYLEGKELSAAYASADLFVFPSTTDTFGNVVLEAQASGLPVIVTDQGGPCENLIPGETGLVVRGDDEADLLRAMKRLISDNTMRRQMGEAARRYMEDRSFENAFISSWELIEEMPCKTEPTFGRAS